MSEETKKGYLWRMPLPNDRYEYYVVKDSMCIDEETEFHYCTYAPGEGGIDAWGINPNPEPFTDFNVLEENLEIKRVYYNKRPEPLPQIEVTISSYDQSSQVFIKKETNGSVLTITPEDFQALQANPNDRYFFGACGSAMADIMGNADYSPHDAGGRGVLPDTTVTIDFGPSWLEMVQNESTPAYMREICMFAFVE